jgi:hypothetical protein
MRIRGILLASAVIGMLGLGIGVRGQAAPRTEATAARGAGGGSATGPMATGPTTGRSGTSGRGMTFSIPATPPVMGEGPTCALDATIYDVRVAAEQIGRLDVAALTRAAASAADFEKAVGELGTVKPLYRMSQSVRLSGDTIMMGTQVPYITNSQTTNTGQTINSVSYTQVGAQYGIAGKVIGGGENVALNMDISVSAMSEGGVPISTNVNAPMFRTATMAHNGTVTAKQPFVVLTVDAANADGKGKAVAYVARVTLGVPQVDAGAGRGP